jgi:hypothetical protein
VTIGRSRPHHARLRGTGVSRLLIARACRGLGSGPDDHYVRTGLDLMIVDGLRGCPGARSESALEHQFHPLHGYRSDMKRMRLTLATSVLRAASALTHLAYSAMVSLRFGAGLGKQIFDPPGF